MAWRHTAGAAAEVGFEGETACRCQPDHPQISPSLRLRSSAPSDDACRAFNRQLQTLPSLRHYTRTLDLPGRARVTVAANFISLPGVTLDGLCDVRAAIPTPPASLPAVWMLQTVAPCERAGPLSSVATLCMPN